jgi:hypothetical protein
VKTIFGVDGGRVAAYRARAAGDDACNWIPSPRSRPRRTKISSQRFKVAGVGSGGGLFWATSLEKIIGGVTACYLFGRDKRDVLAPFHCPVPPVAACRHRGNGTVAPGLDTRLTDPCQFDILMFGPGWWRSDAIRSNMVSMRSDVRALLRPLVRTVGLLVAVALGVVACLLVLLAIVRGSYAETLPPLAGAAALPSLIVVAQPGGSH